MRSPWPVRWGSGGAGGQWPKVDRWSRGPRRARQPFSWVSKTSRRSVATHVVLIPCLPACLPVTIYENMSLPFRMLPARCRSLSFIHERFSSEEKARFCSSPSHAHDRPRGRPQWRACDCSLHRQRWLHTIQTQIQQTGKLMPQHVSDGRAATGSHSLLLTGQYTETTMDPATIHTCLCTHRR